jgi:hypothetical protein
MNLAADLWYVKWFFWSCGVLDRFTLTASKRRYKSRKERFARSTNLCQFFRTLLLGTLVFLIVLGIEGYLLYAILIQPFLIFGTSSIMRVCIVAIAAISILAVFVGFIALVVYGVRRFFWWVEHRPKGTPHHRPQFVDVAVSYYRAIKQQICPTIAFKGSDSDDKGSDSDDV